MAQQLAACFVVLSQLDESIGHVGTGESLTYLIFEPDGNIRRLPKALHRLFQPRPPLRSNMTPEGRAANRRIDIEIVPVK